MYFNILEVATIIQNLSTINYNLYFAAFAMIMRKIILLKFLWFSLLSLLSVH